VPVAPRGEAVAPKATKKQNQLPEKGALPVNGTKKASVCGKETIVTEEGKPNCCWCAFLKARGAKIFFRRSTGGPMQWGGGRLNGGLIFATARRQKEPKLGSPPGENKCRMVN